MAAGQPAPPLAPEAPPSPETRKFRFSAYEQATIDGAFGALGLRREAEPEGKVVESIVAVRLEVIEERDPAPRFLNVFHVLTRRSVVEREVLLQPNDVYRQTLADETQRRLASQPQLSLVLVLAAEGSSPGQVRIVVITKDVWSLRLNWNIAYGSQGLEGLTVNPSETNFLGTHQTAGLLFTWLPASYSVGALYSVPRIFGSRLAGAAEAGLNYNRATAAREGSFGSLQLVYPLWSSRSEWSWGAGASWLEEVTRLYVGGKVAVFCVSPDACVPYAYDSNVADAGAFVTRSFGWAVKHDFTLGFEASRNRYRLPDLPVYQGPAGQAFLDSRVPRSDDRVGPYLQYATYSSDHLRILDLETLALQEDHRLGHEASVRFYPVLRSLGSTRDFLGLAAGLWYTAAIGDGLVRAGLESVTEVETGSGQVSDGSVQATLRVASPRLPVGRFVLDSVLLDRYANHLNSLTYLGGDSRLRGYPSRFFVGSDALALNLEWRSRPLQLFRSVQIAGAVFYDSGDAFDAWRDFHLWQGVGFGWRILFPQLDRVVFRIDVAFPLARPAAGGVAPAAYYVTFGQAFPYPARR